MSLTYIDVEEDEVGDRIKTKQRFLFGEIRGTRSCLGPVVTTEERKGVHGRLISLV